MLNKLKNILGGQEKKEEPPAELPEVRPFTDTEPETAPAPAHKPDHIKADISHLGHMRVIAKTGEEASRLREEALSHTREKKTITYGEDMVSGYLSGLTYLKFLTVTRNSETLCTYPFFNVGKPVEARLTEITECRNGYEGQVEAYAKGSALTFFDMLYYKNKNTYFPAKEARVLLSGIAYVLAKVRDEAGPGKKPSRNEAIDSGYLAFRYENGDVDDYVFRGRVKEAREFDVLGKKAQAIRVPLRIGTDSVIDVYVCATENATREKVHKGDYVSGIMWLQGFVLQDGRP